jgi:GAF domain-containing protein
MARGKTNARRPATGKARTGRRAPALAELRKQQAASAEILRVIRDSPGDLGPVFDAVVRNAARLCGAHNASIFRVEGDRMRRMAYYGRAPTALKRGEARPVTRGTLSGRAILERRTVQVRDLKARIGTEFPELRTTVEKDGVRTVVAVPLLHQGKALGTITVYRREVRPFTREQVALLKGFADQAVIAIENVRLFNETREALERQTATAEILKVIARSPTDVQPVLDTVAEHAARLCDASNVSVILKEGDVMRVKALNSRVEGATPRIGHEVTLHRTTVSGRATLERRTVHVEDIVPLLDTEYPDAVENQRNFGFRTVLGVPLIREGDAIGVFFVWRREVRSFTPQEIALLETFADQAVIAIENVRLFNETKEALERQTATAEILRVISSTPTSTRPVFEAIMQSALTVFNGMGVGIALLEGGRFRNVTTGGSIGSQLASFEMPLSRESASGHAVLDRRVVSFADTESADAPRHARDNARKQGFRSIAAAPMLREGGAIGAISVLRQQPGAWSEKHLELLKTFADQAVIAIENARLFNETREALERQTATAEILRVISRSQTDVQPVFDTIAASALRLCEGSFSLVTRYDGGLIHLAALSNVLPEAEEAIRAVWPVKPSRGNTTARAIESRQVVQIPDVLNDPEYEIGAVAEAARFRSAVAVPMLREGTPIGAITVCRVEPGEYSEHQVSLLQTFADQAVIAIENVRLFNETKEALERQTATAEILRVIAGSPEDVQPVLAAVAERAGRICATPFVDILLVEGDKTRMAARTGQLGGLELGALVPIDRGMVTGRAILERAVVHVADILGPEGDAYPKAKELARQPAAFTGTMLAVPLLREQTALGAILLRRQEVRPFADKQIALIRSFADQAVIAIENVRLFNETKEALERQTATAEILKVIAGSPEDIQPVFDTIVRSFVTLSGGLFGAVVRFDGRLVHFAGAHGFSAEQLEGIRAKYPVAPDDPSVASSRAILTKAPVIIEDIANDPLYDREHAAVAGWRRMIAVPMLREGEPLGAIVSAWAEPGPIPRHQQELLKIFADQAVIAIENVRLFNETKEALERQTATAEILNVIAGSPTSTQPVFDAICRSSMKLVDAFSVGVLRLIDAALHLMSHSSTSPEGDEALRRLFPLPLADASSTVLRKALDTGQPEVLVDIESDADVPPAHREAARKRGWRSNLVVPLMRGEEAVGLISVTRREPGAFPAHQIELLKTFADQAVIAIENVRLFNETKEALEQQTAISEVLRVISGSPTDVQPVLDAVAARAARICEAGDARIFMVEGDNMLQVAGFGDMRGALEFGIARPLDRGFVVGRALLDCTSVHVEDVLAVPEEFPAAQDISKQFGIRTILAVPLVREGRALGAIVLRRQEVRPFSERQVALLKTFADQAAIAIENVRLFNETKEALERQTATAEILKVIAGSPNDTQPVFDIIAERAVKLCGGKDGVVLRFDGRLVQLAAQYNQSPEGAEAIRRAFPCDLNRNSAGVRAIRTSQIVELADVKEVPDYYLSAAAEAGQVRRMLAVPLLREGRAIGSVAVAHSEPGHFSPEQVALLKTFADQAVIAIENVRLFNETKEALERQTATAEILKVIASSPSDVQPVFNAIVTTAQGLLSCDRAAVLLREGDHFDAVVVRDAHSSARPPADRRPIPIDPAANFPSRVFVEKRALHLPDWSAIELPPHEQHIRAASGIESSLMVPLMREADCFGVLGFLRSAPIAFRENEIALARSFADQAVIAIENVRLFKELEARTEALTKSVGQLTVLGEVGRAISSTLDVEKVLSTIVSRAVQLTGMDAGSIYEFEEHSQAFHLRAAENITAEIVELYRREPIRLGEGAVGRAGRTREPVVVEDVQHESYQSRAREYLIRAGSRALLAVPLLREGNILGALIVNRSTPGSFAPEVVDLLQTFATQSAIAIQNARLFREIEDKGRQLEAASQHKSQFLASMSHELRTPLNAILGFNEMLLGEIYGAVPEDMKAPLEDIQTSGKHLLRLINNVLDLAKIEAGRMELALTDYSIGDTVESVRTTLRPLAEAKGLELLASVPQDLPLVHGDPGRISQCFMNLAGNSLKFTKAGRVEIGVELKDGMLLCRVADTGIGIPPEKIETLFTEFKQTDATIASEYGGTGLGLSITRKFIEMHGGRIWVESEPGKGSTFLFELPVRAGKGAQA